MAQLTHPARRPAPTLHGLRPARLTEALVATIRTWLRRDRQRRELRGLDEAILRDVGISRAEADFAADKPFWRP